MARTIACGRLGRRQRLGLELLHHFRLLGRPQACGAARIGGNGGLDAGRVHGRTALSVGLERHQP
jgi:hypothetical protein